MQKIIILLFVAVLWSCSSGKKQLQKGNYSTSIEKAVNRLQSSPNNKKAQTTLREAYSLAQQKNLRNISSQKSSNGRFKWDQIASSYDQMNWMYDKIWQCPACLQVIPNPKNYRNEFNEASTLAAEERYSAGTAELRKGTREAAKEAFYHFERAQYLKPNYKDTPRKMAEARENATLKVLLDQIPVHSRRFGLTHEFFQNRMYEFLDKNQLSDFVRFYSPAEAQQSGLTQPDHVVVMQFDDFVVGQTYVKEKTKDYTQDSVVVGQVEIEGASRDVYGKAKAEFTTFTKYLDSKGLLDMKIYDGRTDRILFQRKMPGQYQWLSEWATFKGDERALTDEQLDLAKLREAPSPEPQFLFAQFSGPIYDQASNHLRNFYRKY
ncbi:MAG: hypothetical protein ABJP45_16065 [Cyclobacteriaceae bacterium]